MLRSFNANLLKAELRRLFKLPGLYIAIGASAVMNALTLVPYAESLQILDMQFAFVATALLQITMLVWGAQYGASAYESGTITRFAFLANGKNKAILTQLAALTAAFAFSVLGAFALSIISTWVFGGLTNRGFIWGNIAWSQDVRILIAGMAFTLIGYSAGLLTRSKAFASAGCLALVLVPAVFFVMASPKLFKFTPLAVSSSFISGTDSSSVDTLNFWQATLALSIFLTLMIAAGWLRATSRKTRKIQRAS